MKEITLITNESCNPTGIGSYTQLLYTAIKDNYAVSFQSPTYLRNYPISLKNLKGIVHITSQNLALPLVFKKYKNCIVTVHDLIPLEYNLFEQGKHITWKQVDKIIFEKTIQALTKAERIICISEATKKTLLSYIKYPQEKIHVVYHYPLEQFSYKEKKRESCRVLYVGSEYPHKNVKVLLEAIYHIKKVINNIELVKVGRAGWPLAREENIELSKKRGINENIIWKDHVEDLSEEYNTATLLVHPSLCEGFGFPVLEAMVCGCPVLSSDKTSLPEVGGTAAEYFNPENPKELAKKIIKILQTKNKQETMRKQGFLQVKKFNKDIFKEQTRRVYELIGEK